MNSLISKIRSLDSFGANYQQIVSSSTKQYQSIFGGLITLIIYGLSLAFFIYNMVQWLDGENLPKVTISNQNDNSLGYDFQEVTLKIMGDTFSLDFDPFDPQELIFQPMISSYKNGAVYNIDFELNLEPNNFHSIEIKDFALQNTPVVDGSQINEGQLLYIAQCVNSSLPDNYKCATQDKIDQFQTAGEKYLTIQIMIQQFNSKTQNTDTIKNELYMLIDETSTYFSQIILKLQSTFIDDGLIFQNNRKVTYLNDYSLISQNIPISQFSKKYNREIYAYFYLTLSPIVSEQYVQYPKLNEVLADTGSIVGVIFYISITAKLFNVVFFEQDTLNQIISLYYKEFSEIKIKYNIFGQIKEVFLKNQQLDRDKFIIYYEKLKAIAQDKLTLKNMIYEISRLQFILQNSQSRSNIIKCHEYGIHLNQEFYEKNVIIILFQNPKLEGSIEIQDIQQSDIQDDESVLIDQDFDLLSFKNTKSQSL